MFSVFHFFEIGLIAPAKSQGIIQVEAELSTVDQNRKGYIWFSGVGILDERLEDVESFVFTVLHEDDGDIPILIEDEIELKLGLGLVNVVERDEGRNCRKCHNQYGEEADKTEDILWHLFLRVFYLNFEYKKQSCHALKLTIQYDKSSWIIFGRTRTLPLVALCAFPTPFSTTSLVPARGI